jgi:hypothetical protein
MTTIKFESRTEQSQQYHLGSRNRQFKQLFYALNNANSYKMGSITNHTVIFQQGNATYT